MIEKLNLVFSLLIFSIGNICCQNIALDKNYILSNPPNYKYAASVQDTTSLTDGIFTIGNFWTARSTLGWQRQPIVITIDLDQAQPISEVKFNTVRSKAQNIYFPQNIYIYTSNDDKSYVYVGDAADTSDNVPGSYLVKNFVLKNINVTGRYVRLSVIPNGTYLFCDEIQVIKGNIANSSNRVKLIPKKDLQQADADHKRIEFLRNNLITELNRLKTAPNYDHSTMVHKMLSELNAKNLTVTDLQKINLTLGVQNVLRMNTQELPYSIQQFNPWEDTLNRFYSSLSNLDSLNYEYFIPENGVQYGAFLLKNNSITSQKFEFKIDNNSSFTGVELFDVVFVPSLNDREVPDPLIPIKGNISLLSGTTEMIIFKLSGLKTGPSKINITINSNGRITNARINTKVFKLVTTNIGEDLNANVWAYLNKPITKYLGPQVVADLLEHHINSIVIPYSVLPLMKSRDFSRLKNYVSNFRDVKNFLLLMGYSSPFYRNQGGHFLSTEWKANFIEWYKNIAAFFAQAGFSNSQIYLYPYDEVKGDDIHEFKNLITWARKAIPGVKFYSTLTLKSAVNTLLPLLDVAQIASIYDGLNKLPSNLYDIWIYGGGAPSRSLSPYTFYRMMSWEAFINDYKGIGFWNYADEGLNKNLNRIIDPLIYPLNSYSVIYNGSNNQIISSRRWEAFRLGIEDYSILQAYSKKFGAETAKVLAKKVLNDSTDHTVADSIRVKMITELTK